MPKNGFRVWSEPFYRSLASLGACLFPGIRRARERQVNVRGVPARKAVEESVDLAYVIYNRVFRKVPECIHGNAQL